MTWAQAQKLPKGSYYIELSKNFFTQAVVMPGELRAAYDKLVAAKRHEQEFYSQADLLRVADALKES